MTIKPKKKKTTAKQPATKYIFIVGGVMSGVGKGVASSSIALLLPSQGTQGDGDEN